MTVRASGQVLFCCFCASALFGSVTVRTLLANSAAILSVYASTEGIAHAYQPDSRQCLTLDQHLRGAKASLDFLSTSNWWECGFP